MIENRFFIDELINDIEKNGLDRDLYNKLIDLFKEQKTMDILKTKDSAIIIDYLKRYRISKDSFKISVNNLGRIKQGDCIINGITPLTGESDLGKSTILKAMYFAIKICNEYENEKKNWLNQLENMKYEEIATKFDVMSLKGTMDSELEELKSLAIDKLTKKFVNSVFSSIFDYINDNTVIELFINETLVFYMDREKGIVKVTPKNIDVIYITDSKILNYLSYMTNDSGRKIGIKTNIACPDYIRDLKERLSSAYIDTIGWWNKNDGGTELSKYLNIKDIPVIYEDNSFKVKSSYGNYCRPSEVGDGLKLKSIIATLAYNGHINENTVLLLDEPESSLYPVEYDSLINLLRALNCPIGMATHSPSLVEKCSEYSSKCYLAEKVNENTIIKESDSSETITRLLAKRISEGI